MEKLAAAWSLAFFYFTEVVDHFCSAQKLSRHRTGLAALTTPCRTVHPEPVEGLWSPLLIDAFDLGTKGFDKLSPNGFVNRS